MTVPNFLASSFYYNQNAITDVATIITDLRTILTSTNNPPWTEIGSLTGVFQSPVDSAGRFMRVSLTRVTATRLNVILQDQNLFTLFNREMQIPASAEVYYHTGQYHLVVEAPNGTGVADHIYAFLLDPSPYALNSSANYVIGNAYRNNGGSIDGNGSTVDQFYMIESGVGVIRQRIRAVWATASTNIGISSDFQGNPQIFPIDIWGVPSGTNVWSGKPYQLYLIPITIGASAIKKIALDDGTLASFKALTIASTGGSTCIAAIRTA